MQKNIEWGIPEPSKKFYFSFELILFKYGFPLIASLFSPGFYFPYLPWAFKVKNGEKLLWYWFQEANNSKYPRSTYKRGTYFNIQLPEPKANWQNKF